MSSPMAWARVRERSCDACCWPATMYEQAGPALRETTLPFRSTTLLIGVGGHHTPSEASVAPTFASSNGLTGVTPRVNETTLSDTSSWAYVLVLPVNAGSTSPAGRV